MSSASEEGSGKNDRNYEINIDSLINHVEDHELTTLPKSIVAPYKYLAGIPSNNNNVRSQFLNAFNDLYYHISHKDIIDEIDAIVSIFHESSLLIDDIEDNSAFRRGFPAAHTGYGVPLTINCGNLMYFIALKRATTTLPQTYCKHFPSADLTQLAASISKILVDEMLNLHHGQGLDIYWRDSPARVSQNLPSFNEYFEMIINKTGGLFRLSIKLLELLSTSPLAKPSKLPLANLLGTVYQVRDDYLNLVDSNYSHMKGCSGEDLIEGKLSLPILHSLRTFQGDQSSSPVYKVLYELKSSDERKANPQLISSAIDFMQNETNSLSWSRDLLMSYSHRARKQIVDSVGDDKSMLVAIIDKLARV